MECIALIPARSGSKGIPDKNIREAAGKPLIAFAIEAAKKTGLFSRIVVTTDSEAIAAVAKEHGAEVPFMRPPELASDQAAMLPVIQHAISSLEAEGTTMEAVALLQPTAPLRKPEHLKAAIEKMQSTGADSVVSVVEVPGHYAPHCVMKIDEAGKMTYFLEEGSKITRRQDLPKAYSRDGTIYLFKRDLVMNEATIYGPNCQAIIIPSDESINLDSMEDWEAFLTYLGRGE